MKLMGAAAVGVLALYTAACGSAPAKTPTGGATSPTAGGQTSAAGKAISACMVTDTGGIDDKSFNAAAWAGLQAANQANPQISIKYVQSKTEADYEPNLTNYANGGCDLIVAVGGLMGTATDKVSAANPSKSFAIVDYKSANSNVYSMQFDTAQAAYLAGYLAAGVSKSGVVGTYGGLKIPPVTIFMDGFADGVAHYNQVHSKNVKVLGWDKAKQDGLFANTFTDQAKGKALGQQLHSQGADVILPVAGGTGLGTASGAQSGGYKVIWVDQDGCVSAAQYCSVFLSTVAKNIADAVKDAAMKASAGTLTGGGSIGTLANNGVQLAPYHDLDSAVPAALKAEIDQLKQDIISGKITVTSPAQPK
ncbi:MAG TPA: BMP family ABC transporter substrate-binding protein [Micromonosporaceae bacterium]|nr:BMP family ABC transporter substrate-binding protein [Micromonosporaceae bacterium]